MQNPLKDILRDNLLRLGKKYGIEVSIDLAPTATQHHSYLEKFTSCKTKVYRAMVVKVMRFSALSMGLSSTFLMPRVPRIISLKDSSINW